MTPDQMAELAARLHDFGKAYPVEIFPEITDAERAEHSGLITRAAAQMGRHFAKFAVPAADLIADMAQPEPVATVYYPRTGGNVGLSWRAIPETGVMPPEGAKLYLAPPARKPLSDEQVRTLVQTMDWPPSVTEIVRAVEQVHGIRSEK